MPDINPAIRWAIDVCDNPDIGYAGGTAPGHVPASWRDMSLHEGKRYCDCSSFIWYALLAGGWDLESLYGSWPFTTYTMGRVLLQAGFTHYNSNAVSWQQGDILVFPGDASQGTGHTEMSYNGYILMGAHNSYLPFEDQVSISNYSSSAAEYPDLYRWEGTVPPAPGRRIPVWLIKKAISNPKGGNY